MRIHTHSKIINNFDNDFLKIKKLSLRALFHSGFHNYYKGGKIVKQLIEKINAQMLDFLRSGHKN